MDKLGMGSLLSVSRGSAEPAFLGAGGCAALVAGGALLGLLGSAGALAQGLRA